MRLIARFFDGLETNNLDTISKQSRNKQSREGSREGSRMSNHNLETVKQPQSSRPDSTFEIPDVRPQSRVSPDRAIRALPSSRSFTPRSVHGVFHARSLSPANFSGRRALSRADHGLGSRHAAAGRRRRAARQGHDAAQPVHHAVSALRRRRVRRPVRRAARHRRCRTAGVGARDRRGGRGGHRPAARSALRAAAPCRGRRQLRRCRRRGAAARAGRDCRADMWPPQGWPCLTPVAPQAACAVLVVRYHVS